MFTTFSCIRPRVTAILVLGSVSIWDAAALSADPLFTLPAPGAVQLSQMALPLPPRKPLLSPAISALPAPRVLPNPFAIGARPAIPPIAPSAPASIAKTPVSAPVPVVTGQSAMPSASPGLAASGDGNPDHPALRGTAPLRLQAALTEGDKKLIKEPVEWVVSEVQSYNRAGPTITKKTGSIGEFSLAPGQYAITVRHGNAARTHIVTVPAQGLTQTLSLNAGVLNFKMIPYTGGKEIKDNITWEVLQWAGKGRKDHAKFATKVAPRTQFILPHGSYVVRTTYNKVSAEMVISVMPGSYYEYIVNLYSADVTLTASAAKGRKIGPNDLVTWQIQRSTANSDGTYDIVGVNSGKTSNMTLREGKYMVIAQAGNLKGQTSLEVKAGKKQKINVVLQ